MSIFLWICALLSMDLNFTPIQTESATQICIAYNFEEPLPEDVKKILDEHSQELYDVFADKKTEDEFKAGASHYHFDWLPNYIVKKSYPGDNRIEGAKKFAQAINENNLHNFSVPQKYTYQAADGTQYVIATFVKACNEKITLAESQQLSLLAEALKWTDCRPDNFIKTESNQLVIIDTEPYFNNFSGYVFTDEIQMKACIYTILSSDSDVYTEEAHAYLKNKVDEYSRQYLKLQ